jgi:hypothetical protein
VLTAQVHKERGVPLVYSSDTYASDSPYWVPDPYAAVHGGEDKGMLMIPYSLCTNDHRCEFRTTPACAADQSKRPMADTTVFVAQGAGVSKPDDWFELLKGEFDQLYAEGEAGAPKMM